MPYWFYSRYGGYSPVEGFGQSNFQYVTTGDFRGEIPCKKITG